MSDRKHLFSVHEFELKNVLLKLLAVVTDPVPSKQANRHTRTVTQCVNI